MADIFFSYKREDRASVERLVRLLEADGLTVWWDTTLVAGERFDQVIHREIEAARCVVVAWSADSVDAVWVRDEASAGRDRGILVPLSLDGATPPLGFRQYQTPDLSGWRDDPEDPRVRQLLKGVRRVLAGGKALTTAQPADPPGNAIRAGSTKSGSAAAARRSGLSRRNALRLGFGAATAGGALAAGWAWFGQGRRGLRKPPSTRTVAFDLVTLDERGVLNPAEQQSAEVFDLPLAEGVTMEFAIIPAGGFEVGSPETELLRRANEGPRRSIEFREPFALARTTVTQAQWAAVVDAAPKPIAQNLARDPSFFHGDELPVETISWLQADEFCQRLAKVTGLPCRLPSEAEWEYSCRAGTGTPFHFGPTIAPQLANYCGLGGAVCEGGESISLAYNNVDYPSGAYAGGPVSIDFRNGTVAARSFWPNRFGLYQMHGNVWEHCRDNGPVDYRHIPDDGSPYLGSEEGHVLRGGAWSHNPAICRSAYRDGMRPSSAGWNGRVGLRVACDLA